VLIAPKVSLFKIVQSWKSYTGRWAMKKNAELGLGVPGRAFWENWGQPLKIDSAAKPHPTWFYENCGKLFRAHLAYNAFS
jgi:hypothetical protein